MSIEGSTIHNALRRESELATADVDRLRAESSRVDQTARELVERKARALMELARHYLPQMSRPAVESTMAGVRGELLGLLAEKERFEAGLRNRRKQAEVDLRHLEARLDEITGRLNQKVHEREELEGKVANALKADPAFQERSELAARAEADLHRDEQRVADLQVEASRKLPAFDHSRLFRYLYDRGFGTPDYRHTGLISRLDQWLARLIRFSNARVGYEFLKRTPPLVQSEVLRRRDAFEQLMGQVEALQKERADAMGLTAVLDEGNALGAERDRAVAALDVARKSIAEVDGQLADLASAQSRFYQQAIERFRGFLEKTGSVALEARAKLTPEPKDDELVASVRASEAELSRIEVDQATLGSRRQTAERWSEDLQKIVQRFRSENYDSSRSYFTERLDLAESLNALKRGDFGFEQFWQELAQSQRFRPHRVEGPMGGGIGDILARPETRVLIEAIGDAVSAGMRESARRGVGRRATSHGGGPWNGGFGGGFKISIPTSFPASSGGGNRGGGQSSSGGGFTTGEGF
jgi:hypothetical protein